RHAKRLVKCKTRKTCPNRNFKCQAEMHHHDGSQLAAYREPAQPDQRIQPDVAGPFMSSGQTKHGANLTNPQRRAKLASARGGTSVLLVALPEVRTRARRKLMRTSGSRH